MDSVEPRGRSIVLGADPRDARGARRRLPGFVLSAAWSGVQRDERGSVLLLGIGMIVVGILAVAVAVDVSAAFLQRRALMSLGDSAALAGAQSIDLDSYYANGASIGTRLSPVAVASAARRQVGIARRAQILAGRT